MQQIFTIEYYLAPHSYFTCQNEFKDTFPDFTAPKEPAITHLLTISMTQEACRTETVPFDLQC
jgi:hypothetical protein